MLGGMPLIGSACGPNLDYCDFPAWSIRADFLRLDRRSGDDRLLAAFVPVGIGADPPILLTTEDNLEFDQEPAFRATISRAVTCTLSAEVTALWTKELLATSSLESTPTLTLLPPADGFTGGFGLFALNSQFVGYESELYGLETNMRAQANFNPNISLLFGFRFIRLDERVGVLQEGVFEQERENLPSLFLPADATRTIDIENNLYAMQLGMDYMVPFGRWFEAGITSRAGAAINFADGEIAQGVSGFFQPRARLTDDENTEIAGIFETGLVASLRVTRRFLFHAGYHMLFVSGVALGPDQPIPNLFSVDPQLIDVDSDALYHGPFIGIELQWGDCP